MNRCKTGKLFYINAGHETAFVIDHNGISKIGKAPQEDDIRMLTVQHKIQ